MGESNGILDNSIKYKKNLETVSSEESEHRCLSTGNKIAEEYLQQRDFNLLNELYRYDIDVRASLMKDILETLVQNISLPHDAENERYSSKAIKGIRSISENQFCDKQIIDKIEGLFVDYETAIQGAYTQLKNDFAIKLEESRKILEQQLGARVKFDIERQSQFRNKWRAMRAELNKHYEQILENYKKSLLMEI